MKHKPTVGCVYHQTWLFQIPPLNILWQIYDVLNNAGISAMMQQNRITDSNLCAIRI